MNFCKFKGKCARDIIMHNSRNDDRHNHSNEKINPELSHLNYDLLEREGGIGAFAYYNKQIQAVKDNYKANTGKELRKDAVTLCSWCITLPEGMEDKEKEFFGGVVDFFKERYPDCIPIIAAVHKDETRPHLHFSFIPTQEGGRLCAKDLETKASLNKIHPQAEKYLSERLGYGVKLLNGATMNGNKTILQMKNDELQSQIEKAESRLKSLDMQFGEKMEGIVGQLQAKLNLGKRLSKEDMQNFNKLVSLSTEFDKIRQVLTEEIQRTQQINKGKTEAIAHFIGERIKKIEAENEEALKAHKKNIEAEYESSFKALKNENNTLKKERELLNDCFMREEGVSVDELIKWEWERQEQEAKQRKTEKNSKKIEYER